MSVRYLARNYCLWLGLAEETQRQVADWINCCARKYDAPIFPPHVTLSCSELADEAVALAAAQRVAENIPPFAAEFKQLRAGERFFQCVFIELKLQFFLKEAYRMSCRLLAQNRVHYMPHISLAYGNFSAAEKAEMMQEIVVDRKDFMISTVQVFVTGTGTSLHPSRWRKTISMPLRGTPPDAGAY